MPLAPVGRLKKKEIVWLSTHKCKHAHTYLEHYNCYLAENPLRERIGFFDIETSNLAANFGIILCYCIKGRGEKEILTGVITKEDLNKDLDKVVTEKCVEDLQKFDRIIGFYSTKFDIPFVRTRAVVHGIPFPQFGQIIHNDLYYLIRNKFRLHSNRLENACRTLLGKSDKTHLEPMKWIKALQGDPSALKYIKTHCEYDVLDLEKLWEATIGYGRQTDTSA